MQMLKILSLFFFVSISFAQSLFETNNLVDEFGDKIGEVQMNVATGTFSNSATNDSPLKVHTILEVMPDYTLEEYKEYMVRSYEKLDYSEKEIKRYLKYAKSGLKGTKNINGSLRFDIYEYEENKASMIGVKIGVISIKTSDGKKIRATIGEYSFSNGSINITGYKELTTGASGVKNQIRYGYYDWSQSEIYNEIVNANGQMQVVIAFGNSTYKFTLE
jgi:hypothetical protein